MKQRLLDLIEQQKNIKTEIMSVLEIVLEQPITCHNYDFETRLYGDLIDAAVRKLEAPAPAPDAVTEQPPVDETPVSEVVENV